MARTIVDSVLIIGLGIVWFGSNFVVAFGLGIVIIAAHLENKASYKSNFQLMLWPYLNKSERKEEDK